MIGGMAIVEVKGSQCRNSVQPTESFHLIVEILWTFEEGIYNIHLYQQIFPLFHYSHLDEHF
jgi:hypothetical protein